MQDVKLASSMTDLFLKGLLCGCYAEVAWKVVGVTRFREGIEATAITKESSNASSA